MLIFALWRTFFKRNDIAGFWKTFGYRVNSIAPPLLLAFGQIKLKLALDALRLVARRIGFHVCVALHLDDAQDIVQSHMRHASLVLERYNQQHGRNHTHYTYVRQALC